jgi:NAD(P)H-nitrite reductase large subunit
LGEKIIDNNGYFNYKDFHLSLIKRSAHLKKDTNNHYYFDTINVFLISNQDTIFQLSYKIDKLNKNIVFKNKGDSISYQYVSVSTGSFVFCK